MASELEYLGTFSATSTQNLNITDIFTDKYTEYFWHISDMDHTGNGVLNARFINSGGATLTSNYMFADETFQSWTTFIQNRTTSGTTFRVGTVGGDGSESLGGYFGFVYNPFDSSKNTYFINQSVSDYDFSGSGTRVIGNKCVGVHNVPTSITGINFTPNIGTMEKITVSMYGVN